MRFRSGSRVPSAADCFAQPAGGALRLSCETVERLFSTGATSVAAEEHRRDCVECRLDEEEGLPIRRLLAPLAAAVQTDAVYSDPLFVPAVLARVRAETTPLRRREIRQSVMRAAACALALLIGAAVLFEPSPRPTTPVSPLAVSADPHADQFLLGSAGSYLFCEWIPSASPQAVAGTAVEF